MEGHAMFSRQGVQQAAVTKLVSINKCRHCSCTLTYCAHGETPALAAQAAKAAEGTQGETPAPGKADCTTWAEWM